VNAVVASFPRIDAGGLRPAPCVPSEKGSDVLRQGMYRDRYGRAAYIRATVTGYLIRYVDGQTVALSAHNSRAIDVNPAVPGRLGGAHG
jgi:hypothetical protein